METIRRYSMLIGGDRLDTDDRFEILAIEGGSYLADGHGV